jgi:thiamine-phosphate diphosphorylase
VSRTADLYIFVERSIFETDAAWLLALSVLASFEVEDVAVQVRTRSEPPERATELARQARSATEDARVPVLLNGSSEQALELAYEGVHWPEALIPDRAEDVDLLRGASVHSPEAAARAEQAGADFLVAGTVFDAGSKPVTGGGVEALRRMASATHLPVLAIGGVTPQRVATCIEAGAAGVAVVTSVLRAPDMATAVRDLREALDAAKLTARPR